MKKYSQQITSYIGILLVGVFIGFVTFSPQKTTRASGTELADMSEFWEAWNVVNQKYTFTDHTPTDAKRVEGAIAGMIAAYGDPYMQYFNPADNKHFKEDVKGSFSGIGVEMGVKNGLLTVISPLKDSPAAQAGLRAGDVITKIDTVEASKFSGVDEAVNAIRGKAGTVVVLEIARKSEKDFITIPVTRQVIKVPSSEIVWKGDTLIISAYSFDENLVSTITPALQKLATKKKPRLVIDLRGNPGGYLETAVEVGSMFLPAGDVIVTEKPGLDSTGESIHRSRGLQLIPSTTPIVVIVDKGSASASEILAGALMDHRRATIVGEQSFGKGSVQELVDLSTGAGLKITVAKWYTPKGSSISEVGIKPDVIIKDKNLTDTTDEVLLQALTIVQKK